MKRLYLSGKHCEVYTLVDDEYYDDLMRYKWYLDKQRYARGYVCGKHIKIHRYILNLDDRRIQVDHIDGDGLNNCKSNLRICTNQQNSRNRRKRIGSSFYKGVSCIRNYWRATITVNRKSIYLGHYATAMEAAVAYNLKAIEIDKTFYTLNDVDMSLTPIRCVENKSSKFRGVCWDKKNNSWCVHFSFQNKTHYLGNFKDEIKAAIAYNNKARECLGDKAIINHV